jgi:hypothetical protein
MRGLINSNNVANSLNNSYEYKFKNGNFTIGEGSQIMITSLKIPYSWYNVSSRYNKTHDGFLSKSFTFSYSS